MFNFDLSYVVKVVGAMVFIAAGFMAYGDGFLFEIIYIALLFFMAIVFIRDINIVSIIVISTLANLSSTFLFPLVIGSDYQIILKLCTYTAIVLSLFKVKSEEHRLLISLVIGLCILAEIYWAFSNIAGPIIYWYVLLININLLMRYFLFNVFLLSLNGFQTNTDHWI